MPHFCPGGDVQETGASNFFLVDDNRLLTKPLDGSFLPGVTRDSLITLARHLGYEVMEKNFTVADIKAWISHGEAALSGTAAVLDGVGANASRVWITQRSPKLGSWPAHQT